VAQDFGFLIVDDNQDSADSLALVLQVAGNTTAPSMTGERRLAPSGSFDRMLSCWMSECPG